MKTKNITDLTDEQLALQLQQGDKNAMGELYSRYFMLVFNKCLSFSKNSEDAGDQAQEIMLRVMEKISSFKGDSRFSTWLYSVTFNYCTDQARKKKRSYFESIDNKYDLIDESYEELQACVEASKKAEQLTCVLSDISEEDKQLLVMKYQQGKSVEDIRSMYNLSKSAVKMRLLRAREKAVSMYASYSLAVA
ncbi:MAG: RNA polymerase sigma factor [Reichenbachiella sp.]|uniref:RNA polymerase sigma factor n=1 Tax=Reichenbachiella sp. TaxID=2184521 RepID=UPI0032635100